MRMLIVFALLPLVSTSAAQEQKGPAQSRPHRDTQELVEDWAPTASDAVIPIQYWIDRSAPGQETLVGSGVVGTGFFVNDQGDFVTAAHVAKVKEIGTPERPIKVYLRATLRQGNGDGTGQPFTIVEIDENHDLALCHIEYFKVFSLSDSPSAKTQAKHLSDEGALSVRDASRPFASLAISTTAPRVGHFVLVSGFPLSSWTPAIQFGLVSAVQTVYPQPNPIAGVPKDTHQLLQVSVNANHGNSGGPVIDLSSGQVIGVILQIVPAPLAIQGRQFYDAGTFAMSGIMLAAPASWIESLLARHSVKTKSVKAEKLVIW